MTDFNPLSSVDISAIDEQMKMAQLDQHRGYAQDHYGEVNQYRKTEYVHKSQAAGTQILREPLWNKGNFPLHTIHPKKKCLLIQAFYIRSLFHS